MQYPLCRSSPRGSRRLFEPMLAVAACTLASALLAAPAQAQPQNFPSRTVRIVVPFPPGGSADIAARLIAQRLTETLGQSAVVENRSGASGTIGVGEVVRSAPDGHTLLMTTGDFITVPARLFPTMPFEPRKALLPIMRVVSVPLVLLGHKGAPFADIKQMVAAAKAAPGKYTYSSPGSGTVNQIVMEGLALDAGIKLLQVPYRGGAPAVTAVTAGEVQMSITGPATATTAIQSGTVRALSLMTKERPPFIKDIPTIAEQGYPNIDGSLFVGLYATAKTPPALAERIGQEVRKILDEPAVRERLNAVGLDVAPLMGEAFRDYIKATGEHYEQVVKAANIEPNR
ncbi:Tripartite tricarboxylate transporter family receptor [Pigmentiphaga humi]|uniref:Tripartite tricarboxylate transporter family receptor n=1 Tax=Pigmentiphaga humi TaxID=2478468 RepID=A0A3P4B2M2_9BURK|nr:tripartite tricarboxylate transporter substrate binding protein [Pigmentiphaga humi]VCU70141.1 Tripartite tricarboxylate transporter family receptor [Pigmentiphaga humi]